MPSISVPPDLKAHVFNQRMVEYLAEIDLTAPEQYAVVGFPGMVAVAESMGVSLPRLRELKQSTGYTQKELDQLAICAVRSGMYIDMFVLSACRGVGRMRPYPSARLQISNSLFSVPCRVRDPFPSHLLRR
jgi:hypothetical protein